MLNSGINLNTKDKVEHNDNEIKSLLLLRNTMPWQTYKLFSQEGNIPLHYASSEGHVGTARLLLQEGADIHTANNVSEIAEECICPGL